MASPSPAPVDRRVPPPLPSPRRTAASCGRPCRPRPLARPLPGAARGGHAATRQLRGTSHASDTPCIRSVSNEGWPEVELSPYVKAVVRSRPRSRRAADAMLEPRLVSLSWSRRPARIAPRYRSPYRRWSRTGGPASVPALSTYPRTPSNVARPRFTRPLSARPRPLPRRPATAARAPAAPPPTDGEDEPPAVPGPHDQLGGHGRAGSGWAAPWPPPPRGLAAHQFAVEPDGGQRWVRSGNGASF